MIPTRPTRKLKGLPVEIPIKNLFYLLYCAWDVLDYADEVEVGSIAAPDLENLMASVLAAGIDRILRRSLERDYQERRADSLYIQGRIDFQETTKRMLPRRMAAHVVSDNLSADTLANRILKAGVKTLLAFPTLSSDNRGELAGLYQGLREVRDLRVCVGDFFRVRLHGNNREYRVLLSVCEMIHRYVLPTEETVGTRFTDFRRDDAKMRKLFQLFVTNFYRRRQNVYRVSVEAFPWSRSSEHHDSSVSLPRLETDIILASSQMKIVIETKFVGRIFDERYGKRTLRPSNVNQVFAYMQNTETRDQHKRSVRGILLYAGIDGPFLLDWTLFGKPLRAVAVDLTEEWSDIEVQLLNVVTDQRALSQLNAC
jgi:5-methylcytosine-specific restriction enzyme subunit McrC